MSALINALFVDALFAGRSDHLPMAINDVNLSTDTQPLWMCLHLHEYSDQKLCPLMFSLLGS